MTKRDVPSTENLALAKTAIEIASELKAVTEQIIDNGGECDDNAMTALKTWTAALEVKSDNICRVKARLEADIEYLKTIEATARDQRKRRERAWESIRRYLTNVMKESGQSKVNGLFTVSLTKGRTSVVVDSPEKLPFDCIDIVEVIKPKADTIKAKLEAGEDLGAGAHLEVGEDYITIRGGKTDA